MSSRYDDILAGLGGRTPSQRPGAPYDDILSSLDDGPEDTSILGSLKHPWETTKRIGRAAKDMAVQAVRHPIKTLVDMPADMLTNAVAVATAPSPEKVKRSPRLRISEAVDATLDRLSEKAPTAKERALAAAQVAISLMAAGRPSIPMSALTGVAFMPEDPVVGFALGAGAHTLAETPGAVKRLRAGKPPAVPEGTPFGPAKRDPMRVRSKITAPPFDETEFARDLTREFQGAAPELAAERAPYRDILEALGEQFAAKEPAGPIHPEALSERGTYSMQGVSGAPTVSSAREPIKKLGGKRREGMETPAPGAPNPFDALVQPYRDILEGLDTKLAGEPPRQPALPASPERMGETAVTTAGMEQAPIASSRGPVVGKGTHLTQTEVAEAAPARVDTRPTKRGTGQQLFEDHRTEGGRLRPVGSVSDDGLMRSLLDYGNKINDATERAQYRGSESFGDPTSFGFGADRRGPGPSRQAKALQNLEDYQRITGDIDAELKRRGYTDETIGNRLDELAQLEETLARDAEANAPRQAWEDAADATIGRSADPTSFDFGANLERPASPAVATPSGRDLSATARSTGVTAPEPVIEQSGNAPAAREPVVRAPAEDVTLNWKAFGGSEAPLSKAIEARITEKATQERLLAAKGYESVASQGARREAFAKKLRDQFGDMDLGTRDGAEVAAMYDVLRENSAALEAASNALIEGKLTPAEIAQANEIISRSSEASGRLLEGIVRNKAEFARSLGYQRELKHMSNDPAVHIVAAQRLAGDVPLSDAVMLEIRRLSKLAQEACGY